MAGGSDDVTNEVIRLNDEHLENNNSNTHNDGMDYKELAQNFKRQLTTDFHSDRAVSTCRMRLKPAPSLLTQRKVEKQTAKVSDEPPSK